MSSSSSLNGILPVSSRSAFQPTVQGANVLNNSGKAVKRPSKHRVIQSKPTHLAEAKKDVEKLAVLGGSVIKAPSQDSTQEQELQLHFIFQCEQIELKIAKHFSLLQADSQLSSIKGAIYWASKAFEKEFESYKSDLTDNILKSNPVQAKDFKSKIDSGFSANINHAESLAKSQRLSSEVNPELIELFVSQLKVVQKVYIKTLRPFMS